MYLRTILYSLPLLFCSAVVDAALPPMPQSIREYKSLLEHEFLRSPEMTAELILSIEKTGQGFLLETTHFIIPIYLERLPQLLMGPTPFQLHFDVDNIITKASYPH